ncbi:MAG: sigma 54-interacting transcriptional regulator [Magnetococcales bacterium]|nr:sigma 54-interacting transcriptional regulator [Magnetococcales bacterium]
MAASVLVVDDDEMIQDMATIVMSRAGHTTVVASSLALAKAALYQQTFDLVITDLRLPDGSGLQLLAEIQHNYPRTHVILITGFPEVETVREALRQGAFDYLIKPVMPTELNHVANRALDHKRFREEREILANRLEAVFRSVEDAIIALDDQHRIIQINNAANRLLGLAGMVMNQPLAEIAPWLYDQVVSLLETNPEETSSDKRAMRMLTLNDNGRERILSCVASTLLDPIRNARGCILVVRDESRLSLQDLELPIHQGWHGLIGTSRAMVQVYELTKRLSEVDSTVLIGGETGTGKELVARALHLASSRRHRPFVAVNCAALPSGLLESELFGHTKGAFTNALRERAGRFKLADGGTIFLDEIGDLSLDMQVRLLRVLQERVFEPVGDTRPIHVDVRVVTATHRNLRELVREGLFREDLFYRLKVVEVILPPLRERKGDLPLLIHHFIDKFNPTLKRSIKGVSEDVLAAFMEYDWPGNVRELEHVLEHGMVVARQPVMEWFDLPPEFRASLMPVKRPHTSSLVGRPSKNLHSDEGATEKEIILKALNQCRWQVQVAANTLGISRITLWRRMKALGLRQRDEV